MLVHISEQAVMPKRVVILGASGVIGRVLTAYLADRGISVAGVGSSDVDLLDSDAPGSLAALLRDNDALVVLAGIPPRRGRDLATMVSNIQMAVHICAALARQPVAHVIYMSSDAVYPRSVEEVSESSPVAPSDPYSAMHLIREDLFERLARVPVAILRSTQICAVHDTHGAYGPNRFLRTAKQDNKVVLFGRGEETRDHIMVEDVVAVIHGCLVHRSRGVLNVATGHSPSFAEVARIVAEQFDPLPAIHYAPRQLPVTHRKFDVSAMTSAFPAITCASLERGVARIMQQTVAANEG
jgi:UDP-glucose 4-epimerase